MERVDFNFGIKYFTENFDPHDFHPFTGERVANPIYGFRCKVISKGRLGFDRLVYKRILINRLNKIVAIDVQGPGSFIITNDFIFNKRRMEGNA